MIRWKSMGGLGRGGVGRHRGGRRSGSAGIGGSIRTQLDGRPVQRQDPAVLGGPDRRLRSSQPRRVTSPRGGVVGADQRRHQHRVQTGDLPDILNIDAFATFAADDLLRPADEVLSPETLADIIPSFAENATIDGVQYGIPLIAIEPGAVLQHRPLRGGRNHRAAGDVGRPARRRPGDHRPPR